MATRKAYCIGDYEHEVRRLKEKVKVLEHEVVDLKQLLKTTEYELRLERERWE